MNFICSETKWEFAIELSFGSFWHWQYLEEEGLFLHFVVTNGTKYHSLKKFKNYATALLVFKSIAYIQETHMSIKSQAVKSKNMKQ